MDKNHQQDHPVYKINKTKIMIKATAFALVIVIATLFIAFVITSIYFQ